jgi:drug/metabolite transporter (DMT)-like permease
LYGYLVISEVFIGMDESAKKGVYLILATAVISGFSIYINKYSLAKIDSSVFTFLKGVVVSIFLFSMILLGKEFHSIKRLSGYRWLSLTLVGFIGGAVPFLLFFKGLSLTSAASGSFIHKTLFILASILAFIFLRERIDFKIISAAVLLLVGNFLLLGLDKGGVVYGYGEVLILLAVVFWSFEMVLSKYLLKDLSGSVVAFGRMFFGSLFILLFLFATGKVSLIAEVSGVGMLWVLITSVLLLLYVLTFYSGLKYVDVSVATSILLLGSPVTTLLSVFFADASVVLSQMAGVVIIAAGVIAVILAGSRSKSVIEDSAL